VFSWYQIESGGGGVMFCLFHIICRAVLSKIYLPDDGYSFLSVIFAMPCEIPIVCACVFFFFFFLGKGSTSAMRED